jgi:hypothetical protein
MPMMSRCGIFGDEAVQSDVLHRVSTADRRLLYPSLVLIAERSGDIIASSESNFCDELSETFQDFPSAEYADILREYVEVGLLTRADFPGGRVIWHVAAADPNRRSPRGRGCWKAPRHLTLAHMRRVFEQVEKRFAESRNLERGTQETCAQS